MNKITLSDIAETPKENLPPLDRDDAKPKTDLQKQWVKDGVVIIKNFFPKHLIDQYNNLRKTLYRDMGWVCDVPYMYFKEIRNLCLDKNLSDILEELIGEPMGVHLNLTGWVSTERNWHQDDYLNPSHVNSWYAATWIALEDIHPDCGVFQYVPGSHKWPLVRQEKLWKHMKEEEVKSKMWPKHSEKYLNEIFEKKIKKSGLEIINYQPKKGDLLIWHGRLTHRGSKPKKKRMSRKTIISHYSSIYKRPDMPKPIHVMDNENINGWYFPITQNLDGNIKPTI